MYHEAFETDSDMQKWDSGCWIRYKLFEKSLEEAPSIEIIRCRECKWGEPYSDKQLECGALGLGGLKFPDDFCSYGERSE